MKKIKLAWIFALFLIAAASATAYTKEDYVQLVKNTDQCLIDCYTIYNICNPENTSYAINSADKFRFDILELGGKLREYNLEIKLNQSNILNITDYKLCLKNYTYFDGNLSKNITEFYNSSCPSGSHLKNHTETVWKSFNPSNKVIESSKCYEIKIKGKKEPLAVIDNVLTYHNYTFSEYAVWNSSWARVYPMNITNRDTLNHNETAVWINVTNNTIINCSRQDMSDLRIIWKNTTEIDYQWYKNSNRPGYPLITFLINSTAGTISSDYEIYCDNPLAEDGSNPELFVFWEPFEFDIDTIYDNFATSGGGNLDGIIYTESYLPDGKAAINNTAKSSTQTTLLDFNMNTTGDSYNIWYVGWEWYIIDEDLTYNELTWYPAGSGGPFDFKYACCNIHSYVCKETFVWGKEKDNSWRFFLSNFTSHDQKFSVWVNGSLVCNNNDPRSFFTGEWNLYLYYTSWSGITLTEILDNIYVSRNKIFYLHNSTDSITLGKGGGISILQNPTHPYMYVNMTKVWNQSGEFAGPSTIENFDDELNASLGSCIQSGNYCDIPLNFSSLTRGILEVYNIRINYTVSDTEAPTIDMITASNPTEASTQINLSIEASDNVNVTEVTANLTNQFTNLTYNTTSGLWVGSITAPDEPGNYSLNVTARDWVGLTAVKNTTEVVYYNGIELAILPGDITYSPEEAIEEEDVTMDVVVRNTGNAPSGSFNLAFKVNGTINQTKTVSVPAKSSITEHFTWTSPFGYYELRAIADYDNATNEGNESNNEGIIALKLNDASPPVINSVTAESVPESLPLEINVSVSDNVGVYEVIAEINGQNIHLTDDDEDGVYGNSTTLSNGTYILKVTAIDVNGLSSSMQKEVVICDTLPDLAITKQDITFSQQPLADSINTIVYATVHNYGGTDADDFIVELQLDSISLQNNTLSVASMSANTTAFTLSPEYGNKTLTLSVDVLDSIPEANESNNNVDKSITVFDITPPIIHGYSINGPVYEGDNIDISVNVTDNVIVAMVNATIDATSADLAFNDSGNELWEGSMAAPAAGDYIINITALDGSGLYTTRHVPLTVYSSDPDLVIGPLDLLLAPSNISEPETLYVNITVHNTGRSSSGEFTIELEVNNVSVDSTAMSVGAASESMEQLSWTADYGEKNVTVKVDTGEDVAETNESNNQMNKPVFIPDVTAPVAPSLSSTPDNWTDQTTHTISWSALSDTNGINNYEYMIDYGDWISVELNTSFETPSQSEGIHAVYVRGVDVPGNKGDIGNISIYIDTSSPETPSMKEWHCGNNWTMHSSPYFTWEDPGDSGSGVTEYFGSINNGTLFSINSSLIYHPNWTTGYYEFKIYAEDYLNHSGNWSDASKVYIDVTKPLPPVINSTTHPDNTTWYDNDIAQFVFAKPQDDSSISGYYYTITDIRNGTVDDSSFWTANETFNVTNIFGGVGITNETEDMGLPDGMWYILAIALDGAGNLGEENSSFMFRIDTSAPAVYGLTPADGSTIEDKTPLIKAEYLDSGSGIKNSSIALFLDGQNLTPFINTSTAYGTPASALSNGTHTANVYVEDNLGHATNITWSFAVLTKNLIAYLDKYEYYRPDNEAVSVYANYTYLDGSPVEGAAVTAEIRKPNGTDYINLTEGDPGIYSNSYQITDEDWAGNVTIKVTADEEIAETNYFLSPEWWNTTWHFRVPLTISLDNDRTDALVESTIDLGKLLEDVNYSAVEQNSIRVIDHESGEKLEHNHDFLNDTASDILFRMNGLFSQGQNKTYWIYFDSTDNGEKPIEITFFEGAWKANEFYLYTNDYADIFCYEDNCDIEIVNATSLELMAEQVLSRGDWYTYPETRSINNTILYINSTKPISVLSRTLNTTVSGTEDEVYSFKGKEFFTLVQKNLWITSYNNSNLITIQDLSDGDDNHSITLNKGGNINYTDLDGDLVYINSTSDVTIVAGYEDDNVITAVFGENNKDYYTPIFGVMYIVGMYNNTIVNVTDLDGGQGSWYGTMDKSQIKEFDFGVNVQIGNGPEFEWGEIHSDKPILVLIQAAGVGGTDALGQFFVPDIVTASVGRKYVTFGPRVSASYNYWYYDVIATENNTDVELTGDVTDSFTLQRGERHRYNLSYNDTAEIRASKRVSVDSVFQRVEIIDQEGYTAVAGKEFSFEENTLGALDILLRVNLSTDKSIYNKGETVYINETVLAGKGEVCDADISSYINRSNSTTSALSLNNEGCYWSSNYVIGANEPQGIWQLHANASKTGYEYYNGGGIYYLIVAADEAEGRTAIETGINNTLLTASIFTDQQVYIRYINESQSLGRFDKVTMNSSQRWAFNYITTGESYTNMTSIGTTINIWENGTLTSEQIEGQVEELINATKN